MCAETACHTEGVAPVGPRSPVEIEETPGRELWRKGGGVEGCEVREQVRWLHQQSPSSTLLL